MISKWVSYPMTGIDFLPVSILLALQLDDGAFTVKITKRDALGTLVAQRHTYWITYLVGDRVYTQRDGMRQEGEGQRPSKCIDPIGLGLTFERGIYGHTD